jgi:hypothetical protein
MITKGSETGMTRTCARAGISSSHYQSKECISRTVRVRMEERGGRRTVRVLVEHDFKPRLDLIEDLHIRRVGDESQREALGAEPASASIIVQEMSARVIGNMKRNGRKWDVPNTMQVAVCVAGGVVIDNDVHSLDVDAATEDVGGDEDALLEVLELSVAGDTDEEVRRDAHRMSQDCRTVLPG